MTGPTGHRPSNLAAALVEVFDRARERIPTAPDPQPDDDTQDTDGG